MSQRPLSPLRPLHIHYTAPMFSNLRHGIHPRPICTSAPSGTDSSLLDLETEPDSDDDYWEEDENGNLVAIVYMDVDEELEMID